MLHNAQHGKPLPIAAKLLADSRVVGAWDKGEGKGALLTNETAVKLASGDPLFTLSATLFYRGDGGFGGSAEGAPEPHAIPDRAPDAICELLRI